MKHPAISIILPVYNEEKNIRHIARCYEKIARKMAIEVLFVEDSGSTDDTRKKVKDLAKEYSFIRPILTHEKGYGISVWNGLNAARGEYVCWTHADRQTDPKDTVTAYNIIRSRKDSRHCYVKGKRYGRSFLDTLFTLGMSVFETLLLKTALTDINAQPNLFHKDLLKAMNNPPKDFSFDLYTYCLAKKKRYTIVRFPVAFKKRKHGQSKWNTGLASRWKFIRRTVSFSIRLKKSLDK